MVERRSGTLLNMIALEGMAYAADMSAAKVGLRSLMMSLAAELGPDAGVNVLGFAPGLVATPLVEDVFPRYARRLGIDFAAYVLERDHNPGYAGLMPAAHAAAGVVHTIIQCPRLPWSHRRSVRSFAGREHHHCRRGGSSQDE